jgi:hypothetical protein
MFFPIRIIPTDETIETKPKKEGKIKKNIYSIISPYIFQYYLFHGKASDGIPGGTSFVL